MIEKAIAGLWKAGRARALLVKRGFAVLPVGGWVALCVVLLVGGRALWAAASRPPHREAIAAAFGSESLFYGPVQANTTGSRITYVRQSEKGMGIFLWDTASGKSEMVDEEPGLDTGFKMRAWPWAPDDSAFIYTLPDRLVVCPANGTLAKSESKLGAGIPRGVAWLTPASFVCLSQLGNLHHFQKQTNGTWLRTKLTNTVAAASASAKLANTTNGVAPTEPARLDAATASAGGTARTNLARAKRNVTRPPPASFIVVSNAVGLAALSSNTIAWGQRDRLWTFDLASNTPSLLLDFQAGAPKGTELLGFCYAHDTGEWLLTANSLSGLWRYNPNGPDAKVPVRIAGTTPAQGGVWLNPAKGGYAYLSPRNERSALLVRETPSADPVRLFGQGNAERFTVTAGGNKLFIFGTVSNEPSTGIWRYEPAADQLTEVVSGSDAPSVYAHNVQTLHGPVMLPSGQQLTLWVFRPGDFERHSRHKKYPLLLGDTWLGDMLYQQRSAGPVWASAIAACGAYVVIVERGSWEKGVEQWEQRVMAVYDYLGQNPTIDRQQVYLFGASAETHFLSELVARKPALWKGLFLLNPGALPDLSALPLTQSAPKMLISIGELEHREESIKRYQAEAVRYGVPVEYVVHKGAVHWLQSKASVLERNQAMIRFMFDD